MSYVRATKSEKARMATISQMKCVACWDHDLCCGKTEVHHLLCVSKRRGHAFTVPLGRWHHQGLRLPGYSLMQMRMAFGPSLRLESRAFRSYYGTDDELLGKVNRMLGVA